MGTPMIVVAGPYGAGQELLVEGLLERSERFVLAKSDTTRPLRPGEAEERYTPRTPEEFADLVRQGRYAEHDTIGEHWYGTPWEELRQDRGGKTLVLSVSVLGACALKQHVRAITVFVEPVEPWLPALEERLREKGVSDAQMQLWLARAQQELKLRHSGAFDTSLVAWSKAQLLQKFDALFPQPAQEFA